MSKQTLWGMCAVLAIWILIVFPTGCTKDTTSEEAASIGPASKPADQTEPDKEVIYTSEDAGPYEGKKDGHLPQVVWEKTEEGLKVTVSVNHEMNAEKPHYIMWIKLMDGEDNLLEEMEFQATDEKASVVFDLPSVPSELKAYEKCNLHGIWLTTVAID